MIFRHPILNGVPNHRQLLSILAANGLKVHESDVRDQMPFTINLEGLQTLRAEGIHVLGNLADRCRDYLSGHCVEDTSEPQSAGESSFDARQDRTNRWSRLAREYGPEVTAVQEGDKLKIGSTLGLVKTYFEWLVNELDNPDMPVRSSKANSIRELYKRFLSVIPFTEGEDRIMRVKEEYQRMSFPEKVAVTKDIDAVLRELRDVLALESPRSRVDRAT